MLGRWIIMKTYFMIRNVFYIENKEYDLTILKLFSTIEEAEDFIKKHRLDSLGLGLNFTIEMVEVELKEVSLIKKIKKVKST